MHILLNLKCPLPHLSFRSSKSLLQETFSHNYSPSQLPIFSIAIPASQTPMLVQIIWKSSRSKVIPRYLTALKLVKFGTIDANLVFICLELGAKLELVGVNCLMTRHPFQPKQFVWHSSHLSVVVNDDSQGTATQILIQ